jgi:hypothetical protein
MADANLVRERDQNGIKRMLIKDLSPTAPNPVKVLVRGVNGRYPVVAGDEPLQATVKHRGQGWAGQLHGDDDARRRGCVTVLARARESLDAGAA